MINIIKPIFATTKEYCLTDAAGKCFYKTADLAKEGETMKVESYISNIIGFLTIVAALYFMFRVIFAGYAFISSSGDPKKIETAKTQLLQGFLGIVVVIAATVITGLVAKILGLPDILNLTAMFARMGL